MIKKFLKRYELQLKLYTFFIFWICFFSKDPIRSIGIYCLGILAQFLVFVYLTDQNGNQKVEDKTSKEFLKIFLLVLFLFILATLFLKFVLEENLMIEYYLLMGVFVILFTILKTYFRIRKKNKDKLRK